MKKTKYLFKSAKVEFNAHHHQFEVYYKNWFIWKFDSCYKFDEKPTKHPIHLCTKESAQERAIARADSLLYTVEVWKKSLTTGMLL